MSFGGTVGAAWEISRWAAVEFGLNFDYVLPGDAFADPEAYVAPFVGGTLYVDPFFSPAFGVIPLGNMPNGPIFLLTPLIIGGVPLPLVHVAKAALASVANS